MKKLLLFSFLFLLAASSVYAQITLGGFSSGSTAASNNLTPQPGTINANIKTGLDIATLSRSTGITYATNSTISYVGLLPGAGTRQDAFANSVYYEFVAKSTSKYLSLTGLKAKLRTADATFSAGVTYRWYYRIGETDTFAPLGDNDVVLGFTSNNGDIQPEINLRGISAFKNLAPNTTVYFRLYAWGVLPSTVPADDTKRGFGFGKSVGGTEEVLSLIGYASDNPNLVLGAWGFNGINGTSSSAVPAVYQNPELNVTSGVSVPMNIERGNGLNAGSLSNSFATTLKAVSPTTNVPSNLAEAKSNQAYYTIKFKGSSTLYTNILGYKMKFRNGTTTIDIYTKYELLIGDDNNDISAQSLVYAIDDTPVKINKDNSSGTGEFFSKMLDLSNVSATVPPGKNAELRIYIYAASTSNAVFGLGQYAAGDAGSVEIYGRTLTESEYLQVLPVSLISFKASKQSNSVRLNWTTASEKDNSYFNVLRSGDDQKFVNIGKINGNGTTEATKAYSLTDYKPLAGANYYKLTQTDFNGDSKEVGEVQHLQFDLSNTSLAVIQQEDQSVKAILTAAKADQATVIIYNTSGNTLYQTKLNINSGVNQIVAPVSLSKGVYILKIKTQSGDAWQAKFVK